MEETSSFLKSLLASHGPNYLEKLFGPKARNNMQQLGGVDHVAIALSGQSNTFVLRSMKYFPESATIDDFGHKMALHRTDVEHLRSVFMAVENGDIGMLKSLGIRVRSEELEILFNLNILRIQSWEMSSSSWKSWSTQDSWIEPENFYSLFMFACS